MGANFMIGTSGWNYPHWKGPFYPEKYPKSRWLEYYADRFDTVELNSTFYRLPSPETFDKWRLRTPDSFVWAIKASRYITHVRRLKDAGEPLKRFFGAALHLESKLGPLLFQLPPGLPFNGDLLKGFIDRLDPAFRHVLEVRHPSWMNDTTFRLLGDRNIALCISDTAGRYPLEEVVTADFVYIRLHGSRELYVSRYTGEELEAWRDKIRSRDLDTFVYFDNDFGAHAVTNALDLRSLIER